MGRVRRQKPELTESWHDVDDSSSDDSNLSSAGEGKVTRRKTSSVASRTRSHTSTSDDEAADAATPLPKKAARKAGERGARRRPSKGAKEPELIMPTSFQPRTHRTSTPRMRMNERSLTSDAGTFKAPSELTPTQRAARRRIEEHWDEEIDDSSDLQWPLVLWQNFVRPLVAYAGSVGAIATRQAKPYLALALLLYLTLGVGRNLMLYTMDQALSPLCRIPGASFLNLPFCPSAKQLNLSGPAEFDKLMDAQSAFNEVLVTTAGGYSLPMEMKRSESSIRDLKHVVEYSNLPSRNELVFEFSGFVETARQASQDLSKFNSRIGRAVDHILSTNHWTLQTIADVAERDAQKGAVSRWASKNLDILAPFKPVRLNRDVLLDQYLRHTSIVEEEILRLINEAQALLHLLDNLDNRLDIIASIATRDGIRVEDNREELFAMLWTKLGGNRSTAAKLEKQMKLLKDVQSYKRLAWAHVSGTIVKLQAISDNLEDLRERVGMPEVVGADRIPLEVHIQNIALGIERLETQRQSSRQIEAESYQRVLDKAESGDRLIEAREL